MKSYLCVYRHITLQGVSNEEFDADMKEIGFNTKCHGEFKDRNGDPHIFFDCDSPEEPVLVLDALIYGFSPWHYVPEEQAHKFPLEVLNRFPVEREDWQEIISKHPETATAA